MITLIIQKVLTRNIYVKISWKNKDNYLAVLANGQSYLSALRLHREDGGYLIEAIETKPEFRNLGYGLSLLWLVRKRIPEGFYLRSEVSEKNIKSLGLHKKLGFVEKEKIENTIIFISKGQRKKKAKQKTDQGNTFVGNFIFVKKKLWFMESI